MNKYIFFDLKGVCFKMKFKVLYKEQNLELAIKQALCEYLMEQGATFTVDQFTYETFITRVPASICKKYGFEKLGYEKVKKVNKTVYVRDIHSKMATYQELVHLSESIRFNL